MMTTEIAPARTNDEGQQYEDLLRAIRAAFASLPAGAPLFTTTATGLYDAFLAALPADRRQHYTCRACRRFVDQYGGLVTILLDGTTVPAIWNPINVPPFFEAAVRAVWRLVSRSKVDGVFLSGEATWGLPSNLSKKAPGEWWHMAVARPASQVFKHPLLSASQAMAEKREDYGMLCRGLAEFPIDVVRQAHTLLTTGQLYRSEKCIGVAKWLLNLHEARESAKGLIRENITWRAVATAPAGFCHVRSSMIGTLLEDIAAGLPFDDIKRKFDEKMNPLQYQRPQAAPSAGNIAQAEKIVATLASAGALARRFARLEDIEAIWRPASDKAKTPAAGVFGHLKPKSEKTAPQIETPPVTMTWEKFARVVLPDAESIEFFVPHGHASYVAMVTAANPDAPPILQWDREDRRNPVSWYLYSSGSPAHQWNLNAGAFCRVTAVSLKPSMWGDKPLSHQGEAVFFLLDGARDTKHQRGGGFFPETLRSEYHAVRATMEAHAQAAVIECRDEATACGIDLQKGSTWNHLFRVTSKAGRVTYKLDRWD